MTANSSLYRLIYVSEAVNDLDDAAIQDILDVSQSNNHERYITGFLAHNGRGFMQALEGEAHEVAALFERIRADDRHDCVIQIAGEHVKHRAFPDWAMNYFRSDDPEHGTMIVRNEDPVDSLMPSNTPKELLHLFERFLKIRPYKA